MVYELGLTVLTADGAFLIYLPHRSQVLYGALA